MKLQPDWPHVILALFAPLAVAGAVVTLLSLDCATVPPGPSCSEDPMQDGCYPPLSDDNVIDINARRVRDAGR